MADLIDRTALLEDVAAAETNSGMSYLVASTLRRYVKRLPAVDAVPVVRCKDCKSWTRHSGVASYSPTGLCSTWADTTLGVDFCSYGERRADA